MALRLKILVVWAESVGKSGGGTAHLAGLCGGLVRSGHRVRVVAPLYKGQESQVAGLPLVPMRLPARGLLSFALMQLLTVVMLPWWLASFRPDVVYVRTCFLQGLMSLVCKAFGVPLAEEVDGVTADEIVLRGQRLWAAPLVAGLDRVNHRLADGLVCVTRGIAEHCVRNGARAATTVAIPNGAPTDAMQPCDQAAARAAFNLPPDAFIVGYAGSFVQWQGLDYLLTAARELQGRQSPPVVFALMGSGWEGDRLPPEAQGLSSLVILPGGDQRRVAEFLNACDAVAIPRHDRRIVGKGSPLKFWESISLGLPVIVPRGSEMDEVLADLGLPGVFDPAKAESFVAAVDELSRLPRWLLQKRRPAVHQAVASKYSWQVVADRVADFLAGLCGRRP